MFVGAERKITMGRQDLLNKLEANLLEHEHAYAEAVAERNAAILVYATETLKQVKAGNFNRFNSGLGFSLREPVDNSREFKRAIEMVKASVGDTIEIDEATFAKWVMGEWEYTKALRDIYLAASAMTGKLK